MKADSPLKPLTNGNDVIFDEPWQAQVLAIADGLVQAGKISASDWARALGAEREASEKRGADDSAMEYYTGALRALETLLAADLAIDKDALTERSADWARAYLATPHGQPVELAAGKT